MTYEADELESRMFQHEMDHLNGVLLIERLDEDTRKAALKTLRDLQIGTPETKPAGGGLTLP
jgi:peptide deformylase